MNDQKIQTNLITVRIHGKEYPLESVGSNEQQIRQVARYVDEVMAQIEEQIPIQSLSRLSILTALNIADELLQLKKRHEQLVQSYEEKTRQILQKLAMQPNDD